MLRKGTDSFTTRDDDVRSRCRTALASACLPSSRMLTLITCESFAQDCLAPTDSLCYLLPLYIVTPIANFCRARRDG
eukprot:4764188-Pleurochrysis_carterae.AAC.1